MKHRGRVYWCFGWFAIPRGGKRSGPWRSRDAAQAVLRGDLSVAWEAQFT